jgi:transcriptional regulator GlxA family with amidase domain
MLTGLTDPQIAMALRAFHDNIRRNWSVASPASEARMSRSIFSERFTSLVGQPPMTYVLNWRIAVARDALKRGERSVDEVAAATGYASASAFSTAFTRTVGLPPTRYARDVRGPNTSVGRRGSDPHVQVASTMLKKSRRACATWSGASRAA